MQISTTYRAKNFQNHAAYAMKGVSLGKQRKFFASDMHTSKIFDEISVMRAPEYIL